MNYFELQNPALQFDTKIILLQLISGHILNNIRLNTNYHMVYI